MNDELTCGTCRHFTEAALPSGQPALIGDRSGECRQSPPGPVAVHDRNGVQLVVLYPRVPSNFPACSLHTPPTNSNTSP